MAVAEHSRTRTIVVCVLAIAAAAAASSLGGAVRALGRYIPQSDIEIDYASGIITAAVLGATIAFWPARPADRKALAVLWLGKCVIALGVMLIYEWNYLLDAYTYFGFAVLWQNPLGPPHPSFGAGSDNVIYLASLIGSVVPSYHAIKICFAMMGLVSIFIIYRAAVLFLGREDTRILYVLGLWPSIIFWSSIIGKDPLQLIGIAIYAYGVARWVRRRGVLSVAYIVVGTAIATSIRLWSGPILVGPLIAIAWTKNTPMAVRGVFVFALVAFLGISWSRFADQYKVQDVDDFLSTAENVSHSWAGGGSSINNTVEFKSPIAAIAYTPIGMFTALFRPLPGEILNPFGAVSGLENLVLLLLAFRAALNHRSVDWSQPIPRWAMLLVLAWAGVYAFIAFNLGSIVRFKLQIYPILLLLLLYIVTAPRRAGRRPVALKIE